MAMPELPAGDSDYRLPDHWILHYRMQGELFERLNNYYVGRVIEIIKQHGAKTVLEVGCGDGWNCSEMVKSGFDVVGIDWSANGIKYASMLVPQAQFFCTDVRDKKFLDRFSENFDAVTLVEVLEHLAPDDCIEAIKNITKTIKLGGVFVLTTPSVNLPRNNPGHYQHFTEEKLRHIISSVGRLDIASIEGYGDAKAEKRHYNRTRWVENRYYCIKPALKWLETFYHRHTALRNTPFDNCHGFIVTMIKR